MSDFKVSLVGSGELHALHNTIKISRLSLEDPQLADSDAIILADATTPDLLHLRSCPATQFLPIFALDTALVTEALCDGPVPKDLHQVLTKYRQNLTAMADGTGRSSDHGPLQYLWALDGRTLIPVRDLTTSRVYTYPLLALFDIRNEDQWLVQAERRGWIQQSRIVDRTRNCASCGGAHLNYIDRCPNCDSLEIYEEPALHCFVCGVVESQALFERGDKLVCPKCQSNLKHIGTDYDRPLEPLRCGDCNTRFLEPRVKAACLECGDLNDQSNLSVRVYPSYRLGPAGSEFMRSGNRTTDIPQTLNASVEREHFLWSMQWLSSLNRSQKNQPLLVRVAPESEGELPIADLRDGWDAVSTHVHRLLDPTEISHSPDGEILVFLMPTGSETRLRELVEQIDQIADAQISEKVALEVTGHRFPVAGFGEAPAAWLDGITGGANPR